MIQTLRTWYISYSVSLSDWYKVIGGMEHLPPSWTKIIIVHHNGACYPVRVFQTLLGYNHL